jgi:hypothetical protein
MKIFILPKFVSAKIKTVVDPYLASIQTLSTPTWKVQHFDFEPDQGAVFSSSFDGAISCYAKKTAFGSGTLQGVFDTTNTLIVDCYGFGDVIETETDNAFFSATREAEKRAQVLSTLAYRAIMDAREVEGATGIPKWYDSELDIQDRIPLSIEKGSPVGAMDSTRAACVYRIMIQFNFKEESTTETLGEDYAGSNTLEMETSYHTPEV